MLVGTEINLSGDQQKRGPLAEVRNFRVPLSVRHKRDSPERV